MKWMQCAGLVSFVLVAGCGTTTEVPIDDGGGTDAPAIDSGRHDAGCHCDDGMFCNGVETCGASGCVAGTAPCSASETCDETGDRCVSQCSLLPDADHDGVNATACGGTDCDDANNTVHPGATELCDPSNLDEDCDPSTFGMLDSDMDGFVSAHCCNGTNCGTDCDDSLADVHPGAPETCNQRDDDCDSASDEGLTTLAFYPDCDNDAYGDATAAPVAACATPTLPPPCASGTWVTIAGDCDEADPMRHAGAAELCNGIDDDCNHVVDDAAATTAACRAATIPGLNTTVSCVSGVCTLGACPTLMGDCNGLFGDGCELDLSTSPAHCGTCTTMCGVASTCAMGACSPLVDITAAGGHTCALYANGHAICWGANSDGQLGDGTRVNRSMPVPVSPPAGLQVQYTSIDAGGYRLESDVGVTDRGHTCGTDGTNVYCWGRNADSQLGNGSTTLSTIPVAASVLPVSDTRDVYFGIVEVGAGGDMSMACERERHQMGAPINTDWAWGRSGAGAIGNVPTQVFANWCSGLAGGYDQACLLDDIGRVYCLGGNAYGQLGLPPGAAQTAFVQATLPSGFLADQIAAGGIYGTHIPSGMVLPPSALTCARGGGSVYCFGDDTFGQRGDGAATNGVVQGLTDATDVAVGGRHACAVRATGQVVCWGSNAYGQLGVVSGNATTPVTVPGITTARAVAAGGYHTCVVLMNGTAMCWGANDVGQLGDGTTTAHMTPALVRGT